MNKHIIISTILIAVSITAFSQADGLPIRIIKKDTVYYPQFKGDSSILYSIRVIHQILGYIDEISNAGYRSYINDTYNNNGPMITYQDNNPFNIFWSPVRKYTRRYEGYLGMVHEALNSLYSYGYYQPWKLSIYNVLQEGTILTLSGYSDEELKAEIERRAAMRK